MNRRRLRVDYLFLLVALLESETWGFSPFNARRIGRIRDLAATNKAPFRTALCLIPLRTYQPDLVSSLSHENATTCLNKDGRFRSDVSFELCVVEQDDLPDLSRFIVQSFGSDAIRISNNLVSWEQFIVRPAVELLNGYSGIVAFAEVLAGLRSRVRLRWSEQLGIQAPVLNGLCRDEQITKAAGTALVLVLAKKALETTNSKNWQIEIIGSVELRLQPCDAKIPFTLPWLDRIERRVATLLSGRNESQQQQQPYLSNLCVAEEYRGQQIGRVLVQSVEEIAANVWGSSRIYLHVDVDNTPAYRLYTAAGYQDVGKRWNPFWAGSAAEIGYFVKKLKSR